jgi:hypothetical protein
MYFGAERRGQGEAKGTSWRHWLNHVRYLSYVSNIEFLITPYRTLYESKGLEFNDVGYLSYSFMSEMNTFSSSRFSSMTSSRTLLLMLPNGAWFSTQ